LHLKILNDVVPLGMSISDVSFDKEISQKQNPEIGYPGFEETEEGRRRRLGACVQSRSAQKASRAGFRFSEALCSRTHEWPHSGFKAESDQATNCTRGGAFS
jgi:hypothetical protein